MKRGIALLLSAVMLLSLLPVMRTHVAAADGLQVADRGTMDSWKEFFNPENINTSHAGGVWTDKSVFTTSPFAGITMGQNNFLVALSAMGSNSVVVGQTYSPTDTMFVLDVSNSMSNNALSNMVTATNNAIRTLLQGDGNKNRVGVVLYGTTASVLLPLDHYTGVESGGVENFIEFSDSKIRAARIQVQVGGGEPQPPSWWDEDRWGPCPPEFMEDGDAVYETTYIKNSNNQDVTTSLSTGGGTYIQGGLWKAWQQFSSASVDTTLSIKRAPVMVLMSDGAPTYSASDFDNVPNSHNFGTGSNSYDSDGFVTQLTSAYVKAKMAEKYGTTAFFYTLGLDVQDIDIAKAVLDPENSQTENLAELWEEYLELRTGEKMTVSMRGSYRSQDVEIDKLAAITDSNYSDRYFAATQISDLNRQFQNIVNEISLSAGYHPTHIDDNGTNYSGYITFVDDIGSGMEVKQVEGVLVGDRLYTGEVLARALTTGVMGTKDAPTNLGSSLVWSVMTRLGLTDTAEVWALLDYCYNVRKSLHFDAQTNEWSNYIVWYGDAQGNYLGYEESLEETATYRNVCYAMLGAADGLHQASDMMYVGIQVSIDLKTGDEMVTFRVPASMLPVVTYQISLDGDEVTESSTATLTYKPADPIRLVYEVGVREDISELDIIRYAKEVDGKYYLYTNSWNENPNLENPNTNDLTYAHFEPGADNEHYFFTDDEIIYSAENVNNPVSAGTALNTNNTYYYRHYIFRGDMSTKQVDAATGTITVTAAADFHFEELSDTAINTAIQANSTNAAGQRVIPKGTLHYAHSHDMVKTGNDTGTFGYSRKQIVDAKLDARGDGASHYELVYMGNNGRLQVQATQGLLLSKKMSDSSAPADLFTFDVNLTTNASTLPVKLIYVNAAGELSDPQEKNAVNGQLQVQLKAGEAVYIYGIPAGTRYSVTEQDTDAYHQVSAERASGTILEGQITPVVFTNEKTVYSELHLIKNVTYLKGASSAGEASKSFTMTVTFTQHGAPYAGKTVYVAGVEKITDAEGKISFTITDKDVVTITHIPVGVKYAVTESGLPAGYSWENSNVTAELQGEITAAGANAVLRNTYTPANLSVNNITLAITKNLVDASGAAIDLADWPDETFKFTVSRWQGEWVKLQEVTRDSANTTGAFAMNQQVFTEAGTYYFRVEETIGSSNGMTYDRAFRHFSVTVADADLDGALELVSVDSVQNAQVTKEGNSWKVTTAFTNIYQVNSTKISFAGLKHLSGRDLVDGEFSFQLYETGSDFVIPSGAAPIQTVKNGMRGDIVFEPIVYAGMEATKDHYYVVKEVIPADAQNNKLAGVTYDTTVYKIKVTVDDVSGNLDVVAVEVNGESKTVSSDHVLSGLEFRNTYTVKSTKVDAKIRKFLAGGENTTQRDFRFLMVQLNEAGQPIGTPVEWPSSAKPLTWDGNLGTIELSFITTGAGVQRYRITEILPEGHVNGVYQGITYDRTEHLLVVTTVDNGDGTLTSSVTVDGVDINVCYFTNTYAASPVTDVVLNGHKTLEGAQGTNRPLKAGEFSFTLSGNGVNETVFNKADGSFRFGALSFNAAGSYAFTITENNTHLGGVTYVTTPVTVTVIVTDNGQGQLVASINGAPVAQYLASFVNSYTVKQGHLTLDGIKELNAAEGTDRPLKAGEFTFILEDPHHSFTYVTDPATGATAVGNKLTVTNDADGKITFPTILYDAVGTHTYTITEEKLTDGTEGIYYDKVVYTVTVEVTDNLSGQLVAKITKIESKAGDGNTTVKHVIDFFNSYQAASAEFFFDGSKDLRGRDLQDGEFTFVLKNEAGVVLQTVTNSNGEFAFDALELTAVGTYKFTIEEDASAQLPGVRYDSKVYEFTVEVRDDGKGQLRTYINGMETNKASADFFNYYVPAPVTDVVINGLKELNGAQGTNRPLKAGEFSFTLSGNGITETVTNKADGSFSFSALTFNAAGSYVFTITENNTHLGGVTYVTNPVTVTVTVTDDGQGQLVASINGAPVAQYLASFVNSYAANRAPLTLSGEKKLEGAEGTDRPLKAGEFSFTLSGNGINETVSNDANGGIHFSTIYFDAVGTYVYTITENKQTDGTDGITYDKVVYTVTVEVTDNEAGQLVAQVTGIKAQTGENEPVAKPEIVFVNSYRAASTQIVFDGTKELEGRDLLDGEFSFLLKDEAGNVLQTATNKDCKFLFDAVELKAVGTYKFTIVEDASARKTGITYDDTEYLFVVVVKDDGKGQLRAYIDGVETNKESVSFTNVFTPEDIQAEIVVEKVLDNKTDKTMGLDGFRFQLVGEGKTLTQTSGADGLAKFTFTFGAEDAGKTFTYKLTEVNTYIPGMTYSEAVYEYTFVVTKDASSGKLSVAITCNGEAVQGNAKFVNVLDDVDEPPKTSDDSHLLAVTAAMVVSVVALAVLVIAAKKRDNRSNN